ncbi:MAG: FumA C-terminus/TtdB family hydratase beta subunit [Fidelibacterota bacterium]
MIELNLPVSETEIRALNVGDEVSINGMMITGRDTAHTWMIKEKPDEIRPYLNDSIIYHCGPVVKKDGDQYSFIASGPTTSIREEPYQGDVIREYGIRGVIGKGGMGDKTLQALKENGAVYLHAVGGAATILAQRVKKVHRVFKLEEFGVPEAMWVIEVRDFRAVVTMDSHGQSLHANIRKASEEIARELIHNH